VELEALDAARERRAADTKVAPVAWAVRAGVEGWKRVGSGWKRARRPAGREPARRAGGRWPGRGRARGLPPPVSK
jgi:hypothetical protein